MNVSITVRHCGETTTLRAEAGTPLAPLLREAGLLTLPCGVGKCGKCLILAATEPCAEERALLGDAALASGLRLACYTRAAEGLDIALPQAGALRVLTRFAQSDYPFRPIVERRPFAMPEPSLDDQRSDLQRLIDACGAKGHALGLGQLAALPAFIRNARSNGGCGNVCGFGLMHGETLVGYTASDEAYALIVDIGTTTVAALLVDTARRRVVAARGEHNAQSPYGADVISRIRHETEWEEHRNGPNPLQQAIAKQVSAMLAGLLEQAGIGDVDFLSLTGNTTMMHLLCGLPGEHIGKAPFIPATLEPMRLPAADLGIASQAPAFLLPGISAYIGADIVASLLAADAHRSQPPFLLVDLGTNAETVLCASGTLYACSAAAGPCFEGATLSCGMAGQDGAIDTVSPDPERGLSFTTIGDAPARGLCGSGVLDALALLLDAGIVDETGRLEADASPLGARITDDALTFTDSVRFTQKDIREVQLAKAAVRAGIDILLREAGMETADVARLYLAGGFGSAIPRKARPASGSSPKNFPTGSRCSAMPPVPARCAMRPRKARPKAPSASSAVPGTSNFPPTRASPTPTWNGCSFPKGNEAGKGETFPANGTPARIAFSPRLSPSFSQSARNAMREKSVPYE